VSGAGERARGVVRRLLEGIAWFSVFHARTVLLLVVGLTALAAWQARGLRLTTDLTDLMPRGLPVAERLREVLARYGGTEPIVLAISGEGEDDLDTRIDLALAIEERLAGESDEIRPVAGLFGEDPWSFLEGPQATALLLYLSPAEIESLARDLTPAGIDRRVRENLEALGSPLGPLAARLIREDPLGFARLALRHLGALKGRLTLEARDGVFVTEDGTYVLLLVRPEARASDVRVARRLLAELSRVAREVLEDEEIEGTVGVGPAPGGSRGVHVGLTGSPAILVDYREILARDVRSISGIAFVAVLVMFLVAFRRPLALVIAGVPLAVGITWTLGFAAIAIGRISVFTAGSVAILSGLAIDFTIHLYNRYLEEIHAGHDMLTAFRAAHGETGLGILAAAATTLWAFLAAGFSSFPGLRHLGVICAAGIGLSLVASLLLVPALTALLARLHPAADRPRGLAGFGLARVLRLVVAHPRVTVGAGLLLTLVLAAPAIRIHLDEDFRRFRPEQAPSIRLQDELVRRIGAALTPVLALVPARDDRQLLARSARLEEAFDPLVREEDGVLAAVFGPARVVPPYDRQEAALEALRRLRGSGALRPAAVERELLAAMRRHGFRVDDEARRVAARVAAILSRDRVLTLEEARQGPLGKLLTDMLLERADGRREGVVSCYPRAGVRSARLVPVMERTVAGTGVPAELLGAQVLSRALGPLVLRDGTIAVLLSAAGVLLILFFTFRRVLLVVLTFVPLIVGIVVSVGLMAWLGIDFNLVSITMVPLILGIGIDNGIHVVHRWLTHRGEDLVEVFRHTGRGIVTTSLTTMVGFGSLVFADYPGLVSSGVLAILGVGATLVTAVTLLPALLVLLHAREG